MRTGRNSFTDKELRYQRQRGLLERAPEEEPEDAGVGLTLRVPAT